MKFLGLRNSRQVRILHVRCLCTEKLQNGYLHRATSSWDFTKIAEKCKNFNRAKKIIQSTCIWTPMTILQDIYLCQVLHIGYLCQRSKEVTYVRNCKQVTSKMTPCTYVTYLKDSMNVGYVYRLPVPGTPAWWRFRQSCWELSSSPSASSAEFYEEQEQSAVKWGEIYTTEHTNLLPNFIRFFLSKRVIISP